MTTKIDSDWGSLDWKISFLRRADTLHDMWSSSLDIKQESIIHDILNEIYKNIDKPNKYEGVIDYMHKNTNHDGYFSWSGNKIPNFEPTVEKFFEYKMNLSKLQINNDNSKKNIFTLREIMDSWDDSKNNESTKKRKNIISRWSDINECVTEIKYNSIEIHVGKKDKNKNINFIEEFSPNKKYDENHIKHVRHAGKIILDFFYSTRNQNDSIYFPIDAVSGRLDCILDGIDNAKTILTVPKISDSAKSGSTTIKNETKSACFGKYKHELTFLKKKIEFPFNNGIDQTDLNRQLYRDRDDCYIITSNEFTKISEDNDGTGFVMYYNQRVDNGKIITFAEKKTSAIVFNVDYYNKWKYQKTFTYNYSININSGTPLKELMLHMINLHTNKDNKGNSPFAKSSGIIRKPIEFNAKMSVDLYDILESMWFDNDISINLMIRFLIDYKRAGDYEQVNSTKCLMKTIGVPMSAVFVTGDRLCAVYARLLEIPCIFAHDGKLTLYRFNSVQNYKMILPVNIYSKLHDINKINEYIKLIKIYYNTNVFKLKEYFKQIKLIIDNNPNKYNYNDIFIINKLVNMKKIYSNLFSDMFYTHTIIPIIKIIKSPIFDNNDLIPFKFDKNLVNVTPINNLKIIENFIINLDIIISKMYYININGVDMGDNKNAKLDDNQENTINIFMDFILNNLKNDENIINLINSTMIEKFNPVNDNNMGILNVMDYAKGYNQGINKQLLGKKRLGLFNMDIEDDVILFKKLKNILDIINTLINTLNERSRINKHIGNINQLNSNLSIIKLLIVNHNNKTGVVSDKLNKIFNKFEEINIEKQSNMNIIIQIKELQKNIPEYLNEFKTYVYKNNKEFDDKINENENINNKLNENENENENEKKRVKYGGELDIAQKEEEEEEDIYTILGNTVFDITSISNTGFESMVSETYPCYVLYKSILILKKMSGISTCNINKKSLKDAYSCAEKMMTTNITPDELDYYNQIKEVIGLHNFCDKSIISLTPTKLNKYNITDIVSKMKDPLYYNPYRNIYYTICQTFNENTNNININGYGYSVIILYYLFNLRNDDSDVNTSKNYLKFNRRNYQENNILKEIDDFYNNYYDELITQNASGILDNILNMNSLDLVSKISSRSLSSSMDNEILDVDGKCKNRLCYLICNIKIIIFTYKYLMSIGTQTSGDICFLYIILCMSYINTLYYDNPSQEYFQEIIDFNDNKSLIDKSRTFDNKNEIDQLYDRINTFFEKCVSSIKNEFLLNNPPPVPMQVAGKIRKTRRHLKSLYKIHRTKKKIIKSKMLSRRINNKHKSRKNIKK
jgi:hypothetical protein